MHSAPRRRPSGPHAARDGRTWLRAVARSDSNGIYWYEHRSRSRWHLAREPSWHWGQAGIVAFLARMSGWPVDMPGEEPGF